MNTPETTNNEQLEKIKSVAEQKFDAVKKEALELHNQCKSITIVDDITLGMANQLLSKMNNTLKIVKEKGLTMRAPYTEASKLIIAFEKSVSTPLEEGLTIGKDKMRIWNAAQDKIKQEKEAKLNALKNQLQAIDKQLLEKADLCATPQQCLDLIASVHKNFPPLESYVPFASDAKEIKDRYLNILQIKADALSKVVSGQSGSTAAIVDLRKEEAVVTQRSIEAITAMADKQETLTEQIAISAPKSNVRKTWKFEISDVNAIPREWLVLDETKAKEYMSANKEKLKSGDIVNGIKFYIDESPMIR